MFETKREKIEFNAGTQETPKIISFYVYELSIGAFGKLMQLAQQHFEKASAFSGLIQFAGEKLESGDYTKEEMSDLLEKLEAIQQDPFSPLFLQDDIWRLITREDDVNFVKDLPIRVLEEAEAKFRKLNSAALDSKKKDQTLNSALESSVENLQAILQLQK